PIYESAVLEHGQNPRGLDAELVVAEEVRPALLQQLHVDGIALDRAHLAGLPGALLLLSERLVEAGSLNSKAAFVRQVFDEVQRQSIRVVEPEGFLTREGRL